LEREWLQVMGGSIGKRMASKFEDTKWVIRSRKPKKDRHNIGQEKTDKGTNNDLQNTTQKTKDHFELHVMGDSIGKRMASSNGRQYWKENGVK
jgi:hypothetical protein